MDQESLYFTTIRELVAWRLGSKTGAYLDATQKVLQKHGGLWCNDETFVVSRRKPRGQGITSS
jgi:hypothetical protein